VFSANLLDQLTPNARVATAAAPFAAALIMRIAFGRNRFTRWIVTVATTWFAINVLMAPYSARMRQDILELMSLFR
jgi:hypothetical protein